LGNGSPPQISQPDLPLVQAPAGKENPKPKFSAEGTKLNPYLPRLFPKSNISSLTASSEDMAQPLCPSQAWTSISNQKQFHSAKKKKKKKRKSSLSPFHHFPLSSSPQRLGAALGDVRPAPLKSQTASFTAHAEQFAVISVMQAVSKPRSLSNLRTQPIPLTGELKALTPFQDRHH
jgi:hypothetical protein